MIVQTKLHNHTVARSVLNDEILRHNFFMKGSNNALVIAQKGAQKFKM